MPTILNEISFFQFDNLIRNRIPFLILNLGLDLSGLYRIPLYQNHLESLVIPVTASMALSELKKRNIPSHKAILIVCENGIESARLVDQLEAAGFNNVFFAKNGVQSLRADASH